MTDQEKAAARPVDESERWLEAGERWNRVLTSGQNMLDNLLLNFLDDEAENWARKVQLRKLAESIAHDPEKIEAMLKQVWVEGAHHGAREAQKENP